VVRSFNSTVRASLLTSLALVSACSQILDIEEARVDPSLLEEQNAGGSRATAGASSETTSAAGQPDHENDGGTTSGGTHDHGQAGSLSSAGKGGSGSSAAGGAGGPSELGLCERYCDQVTRACKGKYEQFRTFDQCVQVCKLLPPGEPGDENTNTVSCRLRQAEFADSEPFVYCKSAGPLGAGKCGSNCVSYCSLMQGACTSESTAGNLEPSYYASSQACLTACAELPETGEGPLQYSSSVSAEPSSFLGNTVFCRTYHVAAALEQDTPDEHCPHAMGGDPCIEQ
jgi:hypothetical protein